MSREHWPVRKLRLHEEHGEYDLSYLGPEACIGMMWQLALDAWAMRGEPVLESRLPRHVVRIERRRRGVPAGGSVCDGGTRPSASKADIDFWVRASPDNAARVMQALRSFRAPLMGLQEADFTTDDLIFQIGEPPNRIDIITGIDGVNFDEAWPSKVVATFNSEPCYVISREHLLQNKRACGRDKDGWDVKLLERPPQVDPPTLNQTWGDDSTRG